MFQTHPSGHNLHDCDGTYNTSEVDNVVDLDRFILLAVITRHSFCSNYCVGGRNGFASMIEAMNIDPNPTGETPPTGMEPRLQTHL